MSLSTAGVYIYAPPTLLLLHNIGYNIFGGASMAFRVFFLGGTVKKPGKIIPFYNGTPNPTSAHGLKIIALFLPAPQTFIIRREIKNALVGGLGKEAGNFSRRFR